MSQVEFKLPDLGEGMVEAEIAEWMVKVGDQIAEEEAFCAMLTDKAAVELPSPVAGTVVFLAGEEGDTIAVGATLIVFETDAEAVTAEPDSAAVVAASDPVPEATLPTLPETAQARVHSEGPPAKVATSPSIRKRAKDAHIDLNQVPGSGPRGRILQTDFEAFLSRDSATPAQTGLAAPSARQASSTITEIKVRGLRRVIAERVTQAHRDIPHFAYVEEIDVTALESLRQHMNAHADADESRLTPLPFIGLALVRALAEYPQCNALYDAERKVVQQFGAVHLGIATQTPDGLKVPVVRHGEARSLHNLAAEMRRVAGAARDNTAKRAELSGSTITITSLGKLGGIVTTPIINSPEVAIIGVGKAIDRPVVIDGQVVVRRMMNLSSSFDHRFVDGYDAARMIQAVKGYLEQPATIFISP